MEGVTGEVGDHKRRCSEQAAVDRLGALPDSLLLHILSFLQMADVIKTALLSRRWRYLWTSTPCLDFSKGSTKWGRWIRDYVSSHFVEGALILYEGAKVKSFYAGVKKKADRRRNLDSWVRFALRHRVEELKLDGWVVDANNLSEPAEAYKLPDAIFTCESLVSLYLRSCRLDPPPRIFMSSLKDLVLCFSNFDVDEFKKMLSGCPSLERIILEACNQSFDLNINADTANWRLKTLKICDTWIPCNSGCKLLISAPSITTLILEGYMRRYCVMKNIPSLVTATLDFSLMLPLKVVFHDYEYLADLLCQLRHVQVLKLCNWCIQALSIGASESSQFLLDFSITSLELSLTFMTCEFPGIFYALQSFIKLEFLTIHYESKRYTFRADTSQENHFDGRKHVMSNERSSNMLQCLKTINIKGLVEAICAVEENETVEEILEKYQNGLEFIRFLLKNSPVLDTLRISAPRTANKLSNKNLSVLFAFASRLLALPRASQNALVIIQDK